MAEAEARDAPATSMPSFAPPALEPRERDVLAELAREAEASVSFQGLRRQLGLHQQALTRTLRRLEAAGLVAREEQRGYSLTDVGARALGGRSPTGVGGAAHPATLVHALLPPHVSPEQVAASLARRWFGGLRWHGQAEGPGETSLHWVVEPGRQRVTVRVADGSISLEADVPSGDAARVYAAARPVLAAIAEAYGVTDTREAGGISTMFASGRGVAA